CPQWVESRHYANVRNGWKADTKADVAEARPSMPCGLRTRGARPRRTVATPKSPGEGIFATAAQSTDTRRGRTAWRTSHWLATKGLAAEADRTRLLLQKDTKPNLR